MIDAGHDRFEAGLPHHVEDLLVVDGDDHAADVRFLGAFRHLDDHWQAANVGERLSGQASRGHARRNEHDGFT
ncbi:hypothetical protein D9M72_599830 [compost metagenome]